MNAMTSVVCAAFLGLGLLGAGLQQQPQGKEAPASATLPGLGDALKGIVGQECWVTWGDGVVAIAMSEVKGWEKTRIELVGRDFLKLSGELFIPFGRINNVRGKKP